MPARVATTYKVRYSGSFRVWKGTFKEALFYYGLNNDEITDHSQQLTTISKEGLIRVLDKMKGDLQSHVIQGDINVGQYVSIINEMLSMSDPNNGMVHLLWD